MFKFHFVFIFVWRKKGSIKDEEKSEEEINTTRENLQSAKHKSIR